MNNHHIEYQIGEEYPEPGSGHREICIYDADDPTALNGYLPDGTPDWLWDFLDNFPELDSIMESAWEIPETSIKKFKEAVEKFNEDN